MTEERTGDAKQRAAEHGMRIQELLDRLRTSTRAQVLGEVTWATVGDLAHRAARLAELVDCEPCNGTGYAAGRCPTRRERGDTEAQAPCGTCGGSGHERA